MKIAVSACLLGAACRYDGKSKPCSEVISFLQHHESIPVCPEIMGGLSIPHPPSEIQTLSSDLLVKDVNGKDTTAFFEKGAQVVLKKALEKGVTHAIFKANLPLAVLMKYMMEHLLELSFLGTVSLFVFLKKREYGWQPRIHSRKCFARRRNEEGAGVELYP